MTELNIGVGLPFDAFPGGRWTQIMAAPHRVIYDSTITPNAGDIKIGNTFKVFADAVYAAAQFPGPVEIFVQSGSTIPATNYTMPAKWYLTCDAAGATIASGTTFSTAPIAMGADVHATFTFAEGAGNEIFPLTLAQMTIYNCNIFMSGTPATLVNGSGAPSGAQLILYNTQVTATSLNAMLMNNGSGTLKVTLFDASTVQANMIDASYTIQYDSTSNANSQGGNMGVAIFNGIQGPTGPAGATGATGATGPAGTGGASYLPATEPPNNNNYYLSVNNLGVANWVPTTGYGYTAVGSSQYNQFGTEITSAAFSASFNFTATSVTVSCSVPGGTNPANQTFASVASVSGSFVPAGGPTYWQQDTSGSNSPNGTIAITIQATAPDSSVHTAYIYYYWVGEVLWGSIQSPVANQSLWNTLYAGGNGGNPASPAANDTGGGHKSLPFSSGGGTLSNTFARLASYGTSGVTCTSGGFTYPCTWIGSATITENTSGSNSYAFFTVGNPGVATYAL